MLLTEALRIVGLMPQQTCQQTVSAPDTDPMLRSVCQWRLYDPANHQLLEEVSNVGTPCRPCRVTGLKSFGMSASTCLREALQLPFPQTKPQLMQRCKCSETLVRATITRMRAKGFDIRKTREGYQYHA